MAEPMPLADFIQSEGISFLAHVLRRLSDEFVQGCEQWYPRFGLVAPPRTASTLHLLLKQGPRAVTEIADALCQSHPLVITWIRQLKELDLVRTTVDLDDRRRTIVALTERGTTEAERMLQADLVIEKAYGTLLTDANAPVFDALWRIEAANRERSFLDRLIAAQGAPEE